MRLTTAWKLLVGISVAQMVSEALLGEDCAEKGIASREGCDDACISQDSAMLVYMNSSDLEEGPTNGGDPICACLSGIVCGNAPPSLLDVTAEAGDNATDDANEEFRKMLNLWKRNKTQAELDYGKISDWDTSNVTNMMGAFHFYVFNRDDPPNLGKWITASVTTMAWMFQKAGYFNDDLSWWNTRNVVDMYGMFESARFTNPDVSKWDTSSVKNMSTMFAACTSFDRELCWKVGNDTNVRSMFCASGNGRFNSSCVSDEIAKGTRCPTRAPTPSPSLHPSSAPSAVPTALPSPTPSASPSSGPSLSSAPTTETSEPTEQPTMSPVTEQPTMSPVTTSSPSIAPTAAPSGGARFGPGAGTGVPHLVAACCAVAAVVLLPLGAY